MKFVYILILIIGVAKCNNQFTFLINSGDFSKTTLEFSANKPVYQLGLRCDNYNTDLWFAFNYTKLVVTHYQRQQYKCSDKNFTITLSNDFSDDYATITVVNYNTSTKIQNFDFITDLSSTYKTSLTANKAITQGLFSTKNDFSIEIQYPSTVYVEIFKCPTSNKNLDIKEFDNFGQYRNLSGAIDNRLNYDIFNTSNGTFYYRLQQQSYDNPDVFLKYQRIQTQYLKDIKSYLSNTQLKPTVQIRRDRIFITLPDFKVNNYEDVEYRITIGYEGSESKDIICGYGDTEIWRKYNSYYTNTYTQKYNQYSDNNIVADFPINYQGTFNIRTTAIVNFGYLQQTIPLSTVSVYRDLYTTSQPLLVHTLTPIIISVLALFGLIVGSCKYKKKRNLFIQQQQLQLLQLQNQIENPYFGSY